MTRHPAAFLTFLLAIVLGNWLLSRLRTWPMRWRVVIKLVWLAFVVSIAHFVFEIWNEWGAIVVFVGLAGVVAFDEWRHGRSAPNEHG